MNHIVNAVASCYSCEIFSKWVSRELDHKGMFLSFKRFLIVFINLTINFKKTKYAVFKRIQ